MSRVQVPIAPYSQIRRRHSARHRRHYHRLERIPGSAAVFDKSWRLPDIEINWEKKKQL